MNRRDHLEKAVTLTCGARDADYGSPLDNMTDIAKGWSVILGVEVRPDQVPLMMVWTKICRAKTSPGLADHYDDGAAYMAIAGECADAE